MFEGFREVDLAVGDSTVHGRIGGTGPPLLLLHGMPETSLMWHRVAPALARRWTVVATDLRGFGASGIPASTPDHGPYAMRSIAAEQVEAMSGLGFERFAVAGHDRGARCAYRMALDRPDAVTRLAVLDIVPTGEAYRRADMAFSLGFWIWSFLAAAYPVPEELIMHSPATVVDYMLDELSAVPDAFPHAVRAEYVRMLADPRRVHAICEQYRAAATLDVEHDDADRGNRRIRCPVLVLWSRSGPVEQWYRPLEVWADWAENLRGAPMDGGHFLPEEAPDAVISALTDFLR